MATDDRALMNRARSAYERSRLSFAARVGAVVSLIPATSLALGTPALAAALLGVGLVAAVGVSMWRGGFVALAGFSGVKAGLLPLALAHCARMYGHVCTPSGCTSLCVPACALGGVMAGLLVERWARRSEAPNLVRGLGAGTAFLTGALGCSCVGASGMLALVVALAGSAVVGRLLPARA